MAIYRPLDSTAWSPEPVEEANGDPVIWLHLAVAATAMVFLSVVYLGWKALWRTSRRADGEGSQGRRVKRSLLCVPDLFFPLHTWLGAFSPQCHGCLLA